MTGFTYDSILSLITFTRSFCMLLNTMTKFYLICIFSTFVTFDDNKCNHATAHRFFISLNKSNQIKCGFI